MSIDPNEDLPDEFNTQDQIARAEEKIEVTVDSRSYGKEMTIVKNLASDIDLDDLASTLKTKLACGGTVKEGHIELQGNHIRRIEDTLVDQGFEKSNINLNR
jgi:translation initiation factor 1